MEKKLLFSVSFGISCMLSSCYYDNFKELHPDIPVSSTISGCDTIGVISYSAQIVPILNNGCTQNCHNGVSSGHDMTNYAAVNADAVAGTLYGSVAQNGSAQAMPQGGAKLQDCDIAKIKKWVDAGAPQN